MLTPEEARRLAASDLLDAPEVPEDDPVATPVSIGPYRIIRRIASGGMGTVYEAEQQQPHRRVAVKVLRPGVLASATLLRFRAEVEILGKLQHPGIAQVFDAGTYDDGGGTLPWFAMEYIEGSQSITTFANEQSLNRRERLALFLQTCDAVQHGHNRGIIHRDLKPQNILVALASNAGPGDHPVVKVIDFGVARTVGDDSHTTSALTRSGQVLGTLQYMSPEQFDGDPDARCDVYALGVVLYELLTHRLPLDLSSQSVASAIRVIQERTPTRPSLVDRSIRGELESVVLKAMEKDPDRRFQTVGELASDVRAWLAGEPVRAKPAGPWTKVIHAVRRHPARTTAVGSLLIAAMIVGSALATAVWLAKAPANIRINDDNTMATLYSRGGYVIREYGGLDPGTVKVAQMHEEAGTSYLLLAVHAGKHHTNKQLFVYDTSDIDAPLWMTSPGPPAMQMPPHYLPENGLSMGDLEDGYTVNSVELADVFPSVPGTEVIAVHTHYCCSPAAVRIYSLNGDVLFEAWHLGTINNVQWLEDSQLLVCTGYRHGDAEIGPIGWPDAGGFVWPRIVFAIKPTLGGKIGWVRERGVPTGQVRWYGVVLPRTLVDQFKPILARHANPGRAGRDFHLKLRNPSTQGSLILSLNGSGDIESWFTNDVYELPDGIEPILVDWPPTTEQVDTGPLP